MTIDVHTHFIPSTLVAALRARTAMPRIVDNATAPQIEYGAGNGHVLQPNMEDLDLRLREMGEQGIDYAVLSTNVPGVDWFPKANAPAIAREKYDADNGADDTHANRHQPHLQ